MLIFVYDLYDHLQNAMFKSKVATEVCILRIPFFGFALPITHPPPYPQI